MTTDMVSSHTVSDFKASPFLSRMFTPVFGICECLLDLAMSRQSIIDLEIWRISQTRVAQRFPSLR